MIDIIIVGYPKSGNTWLTRLVAELVGCPVAGFLDSDHREIAQEGLDRKSDYQCFKSHHQLHELRDIKTNSKKIIYIMRDPRDICISGSKYFHFQRWRYIGKLIRKLPIKNKTNRKVLNQLITPFSYRIEKMVQAVLFGSISVHNWVRIPWATHYKPYIENQCFLVKYEDLLCEPERECKRIITYLGLEREDQEVTSAVKKQSFKAKKEIFLKNNEIAKANFMRIGEKEQWRQGLSKKQKLLFNELLADELNNFGYRIYEP